MIFPLKLPLAKQLCLYFVNSVYEIQAVIILNTNFSLKKLISYYIFSNFVTGVISPTLRCVEEVEDLRSLN